MFFVKPFGITALLLLLFAVNTQAYAQLAATEPTYTSVDLSGTLNLNDSPYGISCVDPDYVYMTIDAQGLLVRFAKSDKTVTILPDNNAVSGGENFYAIARDGSGKLYMNARDWGIVWQFNPSTEVWTPIPIVKEVTHATADYEFPTSQGTGYSLHPTTVRFATSTGGNHIHGFSFNTFAGVEFVNGNIWTATQYSGISLHAAEITDGVDTDPAVQAFYGLAKINPSTLAVTWLDLGLGATDIRGMLVDGNIIWLTDESNSKIYKFDTTTETITVTFTLTAGSMPNELDQDVSFLYVASHKPADGNLEVLKISKTDGATTALDLGRSNTNGGTFAVHVVSGILAWSSDSQAVGLYNLSTGEKKHWNTTTTNNRFMCAVGSEIWVAGKGSASVVTFPAVFPISIPVEKPWNGIEYESVKLLNGLSVSVTVIYGILYETEDGRVTKVINTVSRWIMDRAWLMICHWDSERGDVCRSPSYEEQLRYLETGSY